MEERLKILNGLVDKKSAVCNDLTKVEQENYDLPSGWKLTHHQVSIGHITNGNWQGLELNKDNNGSIQQ